MRTQINALDPNALSGLKFATESKTPEANKAVAKQFESLFLQQMLKTMREAMTSNDGPFDSDATKLYQGLYDQQLASVMSENGGIGLAKYIERQLGGKTPIPTPTPTSSSGVSPQAATNAALPAMQINGAAWGGSNAGFVEQVWAQAQQASDSLGVPAHFLVAQAALETGWGKAVIQGADGHSSYNLFNIKAGKNWTGRVVEARTTEYINGRAVTRVERYRAYDSYAESFQDYANLISKSPRYAAVMGQNGADGFAKALQRGGYATDPAYADKLARIINGKTLRQGLMASLR
jgi:peptidoglycan hydrolase FlgJ